MRNIYCIQRLTRSLAGLGKIPMICRDIAEEKTSIPANSSAWVAVKIPNQEHLKTKTAFIESVNPKSPAQLLPGVIQTDTKELRALNIVNCSEETVTVYKILPWEPVHQSKRMKILKQQFVMYRQFWNSPQLQSFRNTSVTFFIGVPSI